MPVQIIRPTIYTTLASARDFVRVKFRRIVSPSCSYFVNAQQELGYQTHKELF